MGGATQLLCIIAADNRHSLAGDSLRGPDEGVLAVGQAGPILPVRSRDTRCCLPGHVTVATPGLVLKRGPVKKPQRALQKLVRVYHPKPFPDLPCLLCFSCRGSCECFAPCPLARALSDIGFTSQAGSVLTRSVARIAREPARNSMLKPSPNCQEIVLGCCVSQGLVRPPLVP